MPLYLKMSENINETTRHLELLIHIGDYLTLPNLTLRKDEKSVALSNLRIYYTWKSIKS